MSTDAAPGERVQPTRLTTNRRSAPENVPPDGRPRFAWRIDETGWGSEQAAYRVLVARSRGALDDRDPLWDSGRIDSSNAVSVDYGGPPLAADARYWWTVRVWNDEGAASAFADPEPFATAPERPLDGEWIARRPEPGDTNGYRSRWRADAGEEWIQVDLGERRAIDAVELHPTEPLEGATTPDGRSISASDTEEGYREATNARGPVAFGFPDRYRVEVADDPDFADATVVVDRTDEDQPDPRRDPVEVDADTEGRYVRVVATALDTFDPADRVFGAPRLREEQDAWAVFALAALAVRNGAGDDLARDRPVTASSSVESDTWGRDHLTNGAYGSTFASTSPLFRREIELEKPVESARVHVSGLGYGELHVNGETVGDAVLDPGWTDYEERALYRTHEIGDHLEAGRNALGIWLGRGWFSKPTREWTAFGSPRARLALTVEFADGTTREVVTDGDWVTAPSPVVENDIYDGEVYDARRERDGWARPGFDDGDWEPATVVDGPPGTAAPQRCPPIRVTETLEPDSITDRDDGVIVDFGQNHTGWLELDVDDPERGREIELRHAEALDDDGDLQTVDLRTAAATDRYVARGDDAETYAPRFTYHGYRYAKVTGYPGTLTADDVRSKVVHTDFGSIGAFECANDDLNRVQANSRWGLRTNAHSVPTDCPQRDERQGFTGDGQLAVGALCYNFDALGFHRKFLRDHADAQSPHGYLPATMPNGGTPAMTDPTWTYSWLVIPWRLYRHYGSDRALREHYEGLCRYVDFWHSVAEDGLVPEEYSVFGDWVALENNEGPRGLPTEIFTDAYHYRGTALMADIAAVLGCESDAERYRARAEAIAEAFNDEYFDDDGGHYRPGTQAANAVPLALGLAPEGREDEVAAALARTVREDDGGLRTGFLGTPALLRALTEHGYADLAYEVVSREAFPGWVYQVRQGATTVWERWDTDERVGDGMNSRNHSPFTLVSEWFFEALAGIRLTEAFPRERRVDIAPETVADLPWAEGSVETPHGEVRSRWERAADGVDLHVDVPWNVTASVRAPMEEPDRVRLGDDVVWDGGKVPDLPSGVREVGLDDGRVVIELAPGTHDLRVE